MLEKIKGITGFGYIGQAGKDEMRGPGDKEMSVAQVRLRQVGSIALAGTLVTAGVKYMPHAADAYQNFLYSFI